jgi:CRP-like cAMP-binding protein
MAVIHILKQADIFYDLSATQLELIASISREQTCRQGDIIFEETNIGDELYVIAEGEIDIQLDPRALDASYEGEPSSIARLRRGQSFGEIALVDEGRRSARAVCVQDNTKLVIIGREDLMRLCNTFPQMGFKLMRNLATDLAMKMRSTNMQMREFLMYRRESRD